MHDPEKASQSGVEQEGRPMPRSGISLGKVSVARERGATVEGEITSRTRAAASRKRSQNYRRRLSSNLPTVLKAAAAVGLLLVSLLTARLITCFNSLRSRHAGPREVFSGVTSRKLAKRPTGELIPLVAADGGESQDSSPEPSSLGFRTQVPNNPMTDPWCLDSVRVYEAGLRPPRQEVESAAAPSQEKVIPVTAKRPAQELLYVTVVTGEDEEESAASLYRVVMPTTPVPTGTTRPQAIQFLDRARRLWWSNLASFLILGLVVSAILSGAACVAREIAVSETDTFDSRFVIPGLVLLGVGTLVLIAAGINTLVSERKRAASQHTISARKRESSQHGERT
ncbi:hypothetical protein CSUI_005633 [Cystoisospora suis]|uniref:Transmembrane protein n=1 Tax=Cystoisospora suis TaxID=483139 RepID=A0A2C6KJ50_9APIC|nr:hypothetical protein CSUI_005633 [Cystoisospora suis]